LFLVLSARCEGFRPVSVGRLRKGAAYGEDSHRLRQSRGGTSPLFAAVEAAHEGNGLDPELKVLRRAPTGASALVAGEAEFTNTVSPDVLTIDLRDGADVVIVAPR